MTGAGSLSLDTQPVMDLRSPLSLFSGRCGGTPQKGSAETSARPQGKAFPSRLVHIDLIEIRQKIALGMTCYKTSDKIAAD